MSPNEIKSATIPTEPKQEHENFIHTLSKKISSLFKPEEVEVTIEGSGYNRTYTVTKPTK